MNKKTILVSMLLVLTQMNCALALDGNSSTLEFSDKVTEGFKRFLLKMAPAYMFFLFTLFILIFFVYFFVFIKTLILGKKKNPEAI